MTTDRTLGIVIGRFQPFHRGHQALLDEACAEFDDVLVLVGSSNKPRSIRNPFTFGERRSMIMRCWNRKEGQALIVNELPDQTYQDELWVEQIQDILLEEWGCHEHVLVTHTKDSDGSLADYLPQLKHYHVAPYHDENGDMVHATDIRESLFESPAMGVWRAILPTQVVTVIDHSRSKDQPAWEGLSREWKFVQKYKADCAGSSAHGLHTPLRHRW